MGMARTGEVGERTSVGSLRLVAHQKYSSAVVIWFSKPILISGRDVTLQPLRLFSR